MVKIATGGELVFTGKVIETDDRVIPAEFARFEGSVYRSFVDPPNMVLTSGLLKWKGREISLDVSGLANCWVGKDEIEPRFVRLRTIENFEKKYDQLTVCFIKGGAALPEQRDMLLEDVNLCRQWTENENEAVKGASHRRPHACEVIARTTRVHLVCDSIIAVQKGRAGGLIR